MSEDSESGQDRAFTVVVASTGERHVVPPGCSILEVLRKHGHELDSQCENGVCGRCVVFVLEGRPDHRDNVLTKQAREEGKLMTICVSRAMGDKLVLDV